MAASAAGRSSCLRMMCRISMNSGARGVFISPVRSSIPATFLPRRAPFSPSPLRLLRRELSSLRPLHCAIASACLVSKLPTEASSTTEAYRLHHTTLIILEFVLMEKSLELRQKEFQSQLKER